MTWRVVLAQRARADLSRLDRQTAARIVRAIERLVETNQGDVKKLKGQIDRWRLRVGDWRVIFVFDGADQTMTVERVLPRSGAYR